MLIINMPDNGLRKVLKMCIIKPCGLDCWEMVAMVNFSIMASFCLQFCQAVNRFSLPVPITLGVNLKLALVYNTTSQISTMALISKECKQIGESKLLLKKKKRKFTLMQVVRDKNKADIQAARDLEEKPLAKGGKLCD